MKKIDSSDNPISYPTPSAESDKYKMFFDLSPDIIWIHDLEGNIVSCNNRAIQMTRYSREELETMNIRDIAASDIDVGSRMKSLLENKENIFESVHRRKDGDCYPVEVHAKLMGLNGKEMVLSYVRDITGRKQAEEALRISGEQFRSIVSTSQEWIWAIDPAGCHTFSNSAVENILGYHPNEIIGHKALNLLHDDDIPKVRRLLARCNEQKTGWSNLVFRWKHKDGTCRYLESNAIPILDGMGVLNGFRGSDRDITERKKIEETLQKSERNLSEAQRIGHIGSFEYDFSTNTLSWSDETCRIFGIPREYFGNKVEDFLNLIHPEDRERVRQIREESLRRDGTADFEHRIIQPDGSERIVYERYETFFDKNGRPIYRIGTVQDITEQKEAEQSIQTIIKSTVGTIGQEFFNNIVNSICEFLGTECACISEIADDNKIKSLSMLVDGKYIADYSYSLLGSPCYNVTERGFCVYPERACDLFPQDKDLVEMGAEGYIGTQLKDKNDLVIGVLWAISRHRLNIPKYAKEIMEIIAAKASSEIERMRAEDALREKDSLFRALMEHSPIYIFFKDHNIRPVLLSRNFETMLGLPLEQILGKTMDELFPSELAKSMIEDDKKILFERKPIKVDEKHNGRYYTTVKFPVDIEGRNPMLAGFTIDITERKHLEEQLQIRQRMDSLGTLVGGIAHDFNNLLVGIMGNIDMLNMESEGFSEYQKECIMNAMRSCDRAASLIRQFQMLSQGAVSKKMNVDVAEIAEEVFIILEQITDKLIEKRLHFEKGKFYVIGNPTELNQVFMNLGTNAVHAIEERGVEKGDYIAVRAENCSVSGTDISSLPAGEYVHISFGDTGIGMSDEVMKKAFDPLFTTKDKGARKGQGLGLAMVYNIIRRSHNGHIFIESAVGKGTTFHIYLPKAESREETESVNLSDTVGGAETILIVEDEDMILSLAKITLSKYGYTVLTADNGQEGLNLYKKNKDKVGLVLLDLTMPEMSGHMLFSEMLRINPEVKVVISSGHSEDESKVGILKTAKGHIQKPYKLKELLHTVRSALDA